MAWASAFAFWSSGINSSGPSLGAENEAKAVNSDLDQGIEKNLDAALIQSKLHKSVKYEVKNGVVTLTGEVNSEDNRARRESGAKSATD